MKSLRAAARNHAPTTTSLSTRSLALEFGMMAPFSLSALIARLEPIENPLVFTMPITSGGLAALGGEASVTINLDGSTRWRGHAHDSGLDGYDFGISAVIRTPTGRALAFAHSGHVGGTITSGSRDHDWDEPQPTHPMVWAYLGDYKAARVEPNVGYSSDIGTAFEELFDTVLKTVFIEPVGVIVFVGLEIGSLLSTGSLVPGARLAEGILWMAGPSGSLLAIIADGIANAGSQTRELTDDEYRWADEQVFLGALPPREDLVLTDTIGGGNRAFTFPRYDGKITLNMGPAAFDDPRKYPAHPYGQVFIHELVHAWQIHHTPMQLSLLAGAFSAKVCEVTGGNPYIYGPAGASYSDFNLEQQAQIVSDWFSGTTPGGTNQPKDTNSPYFRYINQNIRTGSY